MSQALARQAQTRALTPARTPARDTFRPIARPVSALDSGPIPMRCSLLAAALSAALVIPASATETDPAAKAAFIAEASAEYGLTDAEIEGWLAKATYQQSIVNAMSRPAERVKPWRDYRPIFITAARIAGGQRFLAEHREALQKVENDTGVPKQYIVAIIGVETAYGRVTGSFEVLDALYTLGFHYPSLGNPEREARRGAFFRDELAQSLLLAREEGIDIPAQKGSYAGAMGWGQFMPSSYRAYAKDGDGDGRRDLFNSLPDVFASIANYFVAHGWQPGQPVVARAVADDGAAFAPPDLVPRYAPAELATKGFRALDGNAHEAAATLVTLEGAQGTEHWLGFKNFYVITRYNRSPMYALAVHQLADAIIAADAAVPASGG
jgi:membrane-bound lytic murein transglycosylase B